MNQSIRLAAIAIVSACLGMPSFAQSGASGGGAEIESAFRLRGTELIRAITGNPVAEAKCSTQVMQASLEKSKIRIVDVLVNTDTGLKITHQKLDAWTKVGDIQLLSESWEKFFTERRLQNGKSVDALILHEIYRSTGICDDESFKISANVMQLLNLNHSGVVIAFSPFQEAIRKHHFAEAKSIFGADVSHALTGVTPGEIESILADPQLNDADFEFALILAMNFLYDQSLSIRIEPTFKKYDLAKKLECTKPFEEQDEEGCLFRRALEIGSQKGYLDYQSTLSGSSNYGLNLGKTVPMSLAHLSFPLALETILAANPNINLQDAKGWNLFFYLSDSNLSDPDKERLFSLILPRFSLDNLSRGFRRAVYDGKFSLATRIVTDYKIQQITVCVNTLSDPPFDEVMDSRLIRDGSAGQKDTQSAEYLNLVQTLVRKGYRVSGAKMQIIMNRNHYKEGYYGSPFFTLPLFQILLAGDPTWLTMTTEGPEVFDFMRGNTLLHDLAASDVTTADRLNFVRFVISAGLDVNTINAVTGETAIFLAQDIPMLNLLVSSGAILTLKNHSGLTVLGAAKKAVKNCIRDHGVCTPLQQKVQFLESLSH